MLIVIKFLNHYYAVTASLSGGTWNVQVRGRILGVLGIVPGFRVDGPRWKHSKLRFRHCGHWQDLSNDSITVISAPDVRERSGGE
jgi:hypothetical protein